MFRNISISILIILYLCFHVTSAELSLIPNATHLFLDTLGLASTINATITIGEVRKEYSIEPVISPTFPWEEGLHFYTSALPVPANTYPGLQIAEFRLYYSCFENGSAMYLCVAISNDLGKSWQKPLTNDFPYNNSVPTNRVFCVNISSPGSWPGSVMIDSRQGVPSTERFKLTYEGAGGLRYIYIATSQDGIQWSRRDPEEPIFPVRLFSDTQTAIVYDSTTNRYLAFGRKDSSLPGNTSFGCYGGYPSLRRVLLAVSNSSAEGPFDDPIEILSPGLPDDVNCLDIYNPAPIQVSGALLLLPSSYRHFSASESIPSPSGPNSTANDGILDIRIAVSRNMINYSFISRDAFLPRGTGYRDPILGSFSALDSDRDAGFVFATAGGLIDAEAFTSVYERKPSTPFPYYIPSSYVSLLYWASQRTHGGEINNSSFQGILRATLRREGFAAIRTPIDDPLGSALFTTVALAVPQPKDVCGSPNSQLWILINAKTSVAGSVSMTLLTPQTLVPIPGYDVPLPFSGDSVRTPVTWASTNDPSSPNLNDISKLAGNNIVVQVQLVHAQLFAFEVQCV